MKIGDLLRRITVLIIMMACAFPAIAQREKSTLLPATEAKTATHQCSRPSPQKFNDTWQPSESIIKDMESRFSQIKKLRVKKCCIVGAKIKNPDKYYMQYVGIIIDGKNLIYINAFSDNDFKGWKEKAVITCDGGNDWGVIYDPKLKKFYDLAINGIG
jgi:hypothetical protein